MTDDQIYYDFADDLKKYPDAWCYIIYGGRGTGKTYSGLKKAKSDNIRFCFCKRYKEDIKILCAGHNATYKKKEALNFDLSPFKALNRDMHWNVKAFSVIDGLGGFYNCNEHDEPTGDILGYIAALSMVTKYKGMDLSDSDWIVFDEFVPKIYEKLMKNEGEALLDFYETVARSREVLGKPALKLICFANADNAASPLTNTLEVTDIIVNMAVKGESEFYDADRGIYIHRLQENKKFRELKSQSMIYRAMRGTSWAEKSLENEFQNDFSNVGKINLKGCVPEAVFIYQRKYNYIYVSSSGMKITTKRFNQRAPVYDLAKDNDIKKFWTDYGINIRNACADGAVEFEKFSIYELFMNYTKIFRL